MLFLNGQIKVAYYIKCYKISLVFNDVTYLDRQKIGTVLSTIVDVNIYISVFKHYQLQMLLLKCSNTEIADIPLNSAIRLTWQDKWEFAMKQEFSRTDIYCLSRLFLSHKKSPQFTVGVEAGSLTAGIARSCSTERWGDWQRSTVWENSLFGVYNDV